MSECLSRDNINPEFDFKSFVFPVPRYPFLRTPLQAEGGQWLQKKCIERMKPTKIGLGFVA